MDIKNLSESATELIRPLKRIVKEYAQIEDNTDRTVLNEDELYMFHMLYKAVDNIEDAVSVLEKMSKPVLIEGCLEKNKNGRYELNGYELTSGAPIEIWSKDDYYEIGGSWYSTRIEHNGEDYYAVGEKCSLDGMKARIK